LARWIKSGREYAVRRFAIYSQRWTDPAHGFLD